MPNRVVVTSNWSSVSFPFISLEILLYNMNRPNKYIISGSVNTSCLWFLQYYFFIDLFLFIPLGLCRVRSVA